jgi:HD-GYP domain-containing protein (c-di-GMP phosphodiesterase class II)
VSEKIRRMLEPSQALLAQLTLDPVTEAATLDERLSRLRALVQPLRQSPLIAMVYVGYTDGDFFLVRPLPADAADRPSAAPPETRYVVQSVTHDAAREPLATWLFYDANLNLLGSEPRPDYVLDPRTRPWFANATNTDTQQLTDPYVFYTTSRIGITLSQAAHGGAAVVGLDLALSDLSHEIAGLRHTPRSEIAVIDNQSRLVAYAGSSEKAMANPLQSITSVPVLAVLEGLHTPAGQEISLEHEGELWYSMGLPLDILPGSKLRILVAVPDGDLLGPMRSVLAQQGWSTLILVLSLLPLGWLASRQISRELSHLSQHAQQLTRFDFDAQEQRRSIVREVRDMHKVFGTMRSTIHNFLLTTHMIGREPKMDRMLDGVLQMLVESTRSTSGAVYLLDGESSLALEASYAAPGHEQSAPPKRLSNRDMDALEIEAPDRLALRLTGRRDELLGLLVLHYEADDAHRSRDFRAFAVNLSGAIAVSVETRMLIDAQQRLFQAVVRLLADAIDAKSPYTGGHCERVPEIADMMIDRLCTESEGPYAGFKMNEAERFEFRVGAWLHDCGKITSPEHVIDKATKLEAIHNRIHEVRTRFEVLWRDAVIEHQQRLLHGEDAQASLTALETRQRELTEEFAFVAACNIGGESMTEESHARLRAIGSRTWLRNFDGRLGLSRAELDRQAGHVSEALPATERLLEDRPDHIVPWGERRPPVERGNPANRWGFDMALPANEQNLGEIYNLSIQRGTLTAEDRFRINDHIVQTYIMLCSLPWPDHLARVPEIAATHHERLDGRGYPRKLGGDQLTLVDRVMALADVFEALTAADRPYSTPKKLSVALRIMAGMARDRHLDAELFRYFVRNRLWEEFSSARQRPEQFDTIDDAMIEELAGAAEPAVQAA